MQEKLSKVAAPPNPQANFHKAKDKLMYKLPNKEKLLLMA